MIILWMHLCILASISSVISKLQPHGAAALGCVQHECVGGEHAAEDELYCDSAVSICVRGNYIEKVGFASPWKDANVSADVLSGVSGSRQEVVMMTSSTSAVSRQGLITPTS